MKKWQKFKNVKDAAGVELKKKLSQSELPAFLGRMAFFPNDYNYI